MKDSLNGRGGGDGNEGVEAQDGWVAVGGGEMLQGGGG